MGLMDKKISFKKENLNKQRKYNKVKLPTKKTINFAEVGKKKINPLVAAIGIILIITAAVLFSKFAVFDRFDRVSKAQAEVAQIKSEIDSLYKKIAGYGEINDLYAHYTITEMTETELNRADRIAAIEMLEKIIEPEAVLGAMSFKENTLTVTVTAPSLQVINVMAGKLNLEPNVDYCTVQTASTEQSKEEAAKDVTAKITVYLKKALEEVNDEAAKS